MVRLNAGVKWIGDYIYKSRNLMVRLNDQDWVGGVRIYKSRNLMVRLNMVTSVSR